MAVGVTGVARLSRTAGLPLGMSILYTVCGWAKRTADTDAYASLAALRTADNNNYNGIGFDTNGTTLGGYSSQGDVSGNFSAQPSQDQWFFFAMVGSAVSGSGLTFYWSPEGSDTFTSFTLANNGWNPEVLEFGDWNSDAELTGHFAYLRCWTGILSQGELALEKASASAVRATNLHFDWRLNSNTDTADQSGNNRNPTVTGTLTNQTGPDLGGDPDPAALSNPTPSGTLETQTTATIGATTDQNTGTLYVVVDSAANMSGITATQIIAGKNANDAAPVFDGSAAISTTSPSVGATDLTAGTAYSYAIVQDNDNGESNVVTGTFTTAQIVPAIRLNDLMRDTDSGDLVQAEGVEVVVLAGAPGSRTIAIQTTADIEDGVLEIPGGSIDADYLVVTIEDGATMSVLPATGVNASE